VALAVLEKLVRTGQIGRGDRVAVISTAHGLKFSDFKVGYHEGTLPGIASALRNPSVRLPATLGAVQDAIAARFGHAGGDR
jgi:threonine synthase